MPIITHPTVEVKVNAPWCYEPAVVVQCDICSAMADKCGATAGEAADAARAEGFETIPGKTRADPRRWVCKTCASKK